MHKNFTKYAQNDAFTNGTPYFLGQPSELKLVLQRVTLMGLILP